jgi:hypothetical protein
MSDKKKQKAMPSLDASAFAAAAVPQPDPVQMATTTPQAVRAPDRAPSKAAPVTGKPPSRAGKVQLNVWVSPATRQKLLHRKADTGQSIEEMVSTAIDMMLTR